MDGVDGWCGWMDGVGGWCGWMVWMDGVDGWVVWMDGVGGWMDGWMVWMDGVDGREAQVPEIFKITFKKKIRKTHYQFCSRLPPPL